MSPEDENKKRAREEAEGDNKAAKQAKKRKRGKKGKSPAADEVLFITEREGVNKAFERMDGFLLADHFLQRVRRFGKHLSSIELADLLISANTIKDTSDWATSPRSKENLAAFLQKFSEGGRDALKKAPAVTGSPHTIVVTGAGLRAADLTRCVREFHEAGAQVVKLFAKHIKLAEAVSLLQERRVTIGVGTPTRLLELIDQGVLNLDNLKRVVVDASHINLKTQGVMDTAETMMPLAQLLSRKELKDRYASEHKTIDLMFY